MYTTSLGYALVTCGMFTYESAKYTDDPYSGFSHYPEYVGLMFAGSFLACFFWVRSIAADEKYCCVCVCVCVCAITAIYNIICCRL